MVHNEIQKSMLRMMQSRSINVKHISNFNMLMEFLTANYADSLLVDRVQTSLAFK